MIVTDKKYSMDKKLIEKLDLICDRFKKKLDALIIIDGDEGYGKSTMAAAIGYYVARKMRRSFSVDNFFFSAEKLLEKGVSSEEQILIWDEAALAGLAAEWRNKAQRQLIKLLMIARKKRHLYIFNIPKFFKLNEYIALDRALGLIHVYARKEKHLGRFTYYTKKNKESLFNDWRKKKKRNYKKIRHLHGTFPDVLGKIIDEEVYNIKKDEAILSLLEQEKMTKAQQQRDAALRVIKELTKKTNEEIRDLVTKKGGEIGIATVFRATGPEMRKINQIQP